VSSSSQRPGRSLAARLAVALTSADGVCIVAGMVIAFLIADHSSSDSSPSSLVAVGLGGIGVVLVVLGCVLFAGLAVGRLWHWARRLRPGGSGSRSIR